MTAWDFLGRYNKALFVDYLPVTALTAVAVFAAWIGIKIGSPSPYRGIPYRRICMMTTAACGGVAFLWVICAWIKSWIRAPMSDIAQEIRLADWWSCIRHPVKYARALRHAKREIDTLKGEIEEWKAELLRVDDNLMRAMDRESHEEPKGIGDQPRVLEKLIDKISSLPDAAREPAKHEQASGAEAFIIMEVDEIKPELWLPALRLSGSPHIAHGALPPKVEGGPVTTVHHPERFLEELEKRTGSASIRLFTVDKFLGGRVRESIFVTFAQMVDLTTPTRREYRRVILTIDNETPPENRLPLLKRLVGRLRFIDGLKIVEYSPPIEI